MIFSASSATKAMRLNICGSPPSSFALPIASALSRSVSCLNLASGSPPPTRASTGGSFGYSGAIPLSTYTSSSSGGGSSYRPGGSYAVTGKTRSRLSSFSISVNVAASSSPNIATNTSFSSRRASVTLSGTPADGVSTSSPSKYSFLSATIRDLVVSQAAVASGAECPLSRRNRTSSDGSPCRVFSSFAHCGSSGSNSIDSFASLSLLSTDAGAKDNPSNAASPPSSPLCPSPCRVALILLASISSRMGSYIPSCTFLVRFFRSIILLSLSFIS
mmetsp:Transcript_24186/g.49907  ORF Transcript_24186/g.49907 Transcript_24186/m.49907 type:complete len:274 (-) Transcript_24186:133-954(-)